MIEDLIEKNGIIKAKLLEDLKMSKTRFNKLKENPELLKLEELLILKNWLQKNTLNEILTEFDLNFYNDFEINLGGILFFCKKLNLEPIKTIEEILKDYENNNS